MKQQLIIVNNALRDLRGHYFETSISLAEAAAQAGLHPVLATHVDCPAHLFPDWLEVYPVFTTDHWMSGPPAAPPDVAGLHIDPYSRRHISADDVRGNGATVLDFVMDRFLPVGPWGTGEPGDALSAKRMAFAGRKSLRWALSKSFWSCERAAYYFLPAFIYDMALASVPRLFRADHRRRFLNRLHGLVARLRRHPPAVARQRNQAVVLSRPAASQHPNFWEETKRLAGREIVHEVDHAAIFRRDLEYLLSITGFSAEDHVLFGTAHARELIAVQAVARQLDDDRCPCFHLEYRHPLLQDRDDPEELCQSPNVRQHQFFFSRYRQLGASPRIRLYTDTPELADEYSLVTSCAFEVLPIPFRAGLIRPRPPSARFSLTIAYFGDARDEKGFHWLPALVDAVARREDRPTRVNFKFQASIGAPQYSPKSVLALHRLANHPSGAVQLFGVDAPLSPEAYYDLVSAADVVVLPYEQKRYQSASSGTLAEAIAAGLPTVVPAESWMSTQIPRGAGEVFHDQASFIEAVERVIGDYESYRRQAQAHRERWLSRHTPEALVAQLVSIADRNAPSASAEADEADHRHEAQDQSAVGTIRNGDWSLAA